MPSVNVQSGADSSHDISLSDGSTTYGLIYYSGGIAVLQESPLSPPANPFNINQENWIGGRGRKTYKEDPTGFFDSQFLWSTSEEQLFPALQSRWADGLRSHNTYMPADNQTYKWWNLYAGGDARYLSTSFVASGTYTTGKIYLHVRRVGTPGTLTLELCPDSTGNPGTPSDTVTKTVSDITDTTERIVSFDVTEALTSGNTHHIKIYGAGTDNSSNYWQVLTNDDGSTSKSSTDNSAWSSANVSMYYRVIDNTTIEGNVYFFELESALYAVRTYPDRTTASKLYINGVRGTATAGTTTTLTDSNLSMTADQYIGAYIRIIDGAGDGIVRRITDNDATSFTFADAGVTLTTSSKYVVYKTDYWTEIGTTGLGHVVSTPVVAGKVAYFPQGGTAIRRMRVNASSHDFAADGTNTAGVMYVHADTTQPRVYVGSPASSTLKWSPVQAWGTDLALSSAINIGASDYRINNMIGHNGQLHILKEDGIYTYHNNVVTKLGSNFDDLPSFNNGRGAGVKNGYLWFGWANSIIRMTGSSIKDMMNFKLGYEGNGPGKKGYVTSVVSAVGWLFVAIKGDASNYSSILVWNDYGWHEIYKNWDTSVSIDKMTWQPNIDTNPRLWFNVGSQVKYIEFPYHSSNPTKDSAQNYAPEGVITTATYDASDPHLYKIFADLRMYIQQGSCDIEYQTNSNVGTSNWTVLSSASTSPVTDIVLDLGQILKIRFRIRLQSAHSRTPCILQGWLVTGKKMPRTKYQWMATFRADSEADTYQDEPDHDPTTVYNQLITWAEKQTKLTMRSTSVSADNKVVTITLPTKGVDWVDGTQWGGRISFAIMET